VSCCLHLQGEVTVAGKKGRYIGMECQKRRRGGWKPMLLVAGGGHFESGHISLPLGSLHTLTLPVGNGLRWE